MLMDIVNINTRIALEDLGEDIVKFAKIEIGRKRRVKSASSGKFYTKTINSSGNLRDSLEYAIKPGEDNLTLTISAADYSENVDKGRKPGKGVNPNILESWIKNKPVRLRSNGKFIEMNAKNISNFAGYVSYKIKKFGIEPTNYMSDAIDKALDKHEDNLNKVIKEDFTIQLRNVLIKLSNI